MLPKCDELVSDWSTFYLHFRNPWQTDNPSINLNLFGEVQSSNAMAIVAARFVERPGVVRITYRNDDPSKFVPPPVDLFEEQVLNLEWGFVWIESTLVEMIIVMSVIDLTSRQLDCARTSEKRTSSRHSRKSSNAWSAAANSRASRHWQRTARWWGWIRPYQNMLKETYPLGPTTQAGRDQIEAQTGEKAAYRRSQRRCESSSVATDGRESAPSSRPCRRWHMVSQNSLGAEC